MALPRESMVADIKEKTQQFLSSKEHSNGFVDILEYMQSAEVGVVIAAIKASHKICMNLLSTDKLYHCKDGSSLENVTATQKYESWLFERYQDCIENLINSMTHSSSNVQELALCTLMKFVECESQHPPKPHNPEWYFPSTLFTKIVHVLLSTDVDMRKLLGRFQEYVEYDDIRYYMLKRITGKTTRFKKNTQNVDTDVLIQNIFCILEQISRVISTDKEKELDNFLTKLPDAVDKCKVTVQKEHQIVFDTAWFTLLQCQLPNSIYKRILILLPEHIIPHMRNPVLLIDFLTASYNMGGAISLLALNGLFILVHHHNLEYPDFFKKLYALLDPAILHVKYRARFFFLTDLFLKSTHLPAYLVAAFVKRLSRLSLTAPPNAILLVIPLICNLIHRHPNLITLIHKPDAQTDISGDPYDMEEPDPAKCHAMESSLWEIKTLKSHYYHEVATSATKIEKRFQKEEWDIAEYLELEMSELIDKEVKKKMRKMPMEFEQPTGLFGGNSDKMKDLWTL
ncbi:nucleolar complex protein 4 homolog B-like [Saccoglossus kowalevskii]|uniref:Nucleolar complex protein 4 homolog B-like n=1 Tax=Saccoglossus kowalevskii TaxID=10224 RepID=A0ABM0GND1_SACKO|nr:PREDICTED: nucleolar complex protein 4 homolog B-like [Saccoglossus kowalevskii]